MPRRIQDQIRDLSEGKKDVGCLNDVCNLHPLYVCTWGGGACGSKGVQGVVTVSLDKVDSDKYILHIPFTVLFTQLSTIPTSKLIW